MSLAMPAEVPEQMYEVPIGTSAVVRPGENFTILAIGRMVHEALAAAKTLEGLGVDCEVIDVRSIQPFDSATAVASIEKTHRALIVHEAVRFGGFGGEIVAQLQEEAFDYLDAPIARVGAPFSPVPYSPALEKVYIPNADNIVAEVKKVLGL
jgi:pyruvate dehydrogenase E1 component beta subunit